MFWQRFSKWMLGIVLYICACLETWDEFQLIFPTVVDSKILKQNEQKYSMVRIFRAIFQSHFFNLIIVSIF